MSDSVANNKRIAKNTVVLYVRMLFTMAVAFYTSRVILATLGVEDFGVSNIVGGVALMFSFLNSSLSGATSRFLTVSLGEGNMAKMKETFSSTFTIHLILSLIIFVLCETVGVWMLETKLVIPEDRMMAARVLFQLSIITTMAQITQVPYTAIVIAHEKMTVYAYISIADVVLKLVVVYLLTIIPFDKLIVYGVLYFCVRILILMANRLYALKAFEECNSKICTKKELLIPMLKFSGWDLFGNMSIMARTQGIDILQNMFWGPIINAASGVSGQVMNVITGFSGNFITAVRPQIIKLHAQGNFAEMQKLTERGSRLAFFLLFFISFPCFLELPKVMDLWLEEVPDYSVAFVRFAIIFNLAVIMFFPLSAVIHATGRMKRISLINGTLYLIVLPITYIAYKLTSVSPMLPYAVNALLGLVGGLCNLYTVKLYVSNFNAKQYMIHAPLRGLLTALIASVIPTFFYMTLDNNWTSFFIVCITCVVSSALSILYIGLNKHERVTVVNGVLTKLHIKK